MNSAYLNQDEFEIFKNLACYIGCLLNPKNDIDLNEEGKKKVVAEMSCYGKDTIRNKWCKKKPSLLHMNFRCFCNNFIEAYEKYPDHKDMKKKYEVFAQWVNTICERAKWKIPIKLNHEIIKDAPENSRNDLVVIDNLAYISHEEKGKIVLELVQRFYSAIQKKEFKEAWSYLSDEGKWNTSDLDSYDHFRLKLYGKDIIEFDISEAFSLHDNIFECKVEYTYNEVSIKINFDSFKTSPAEEQHEFANILSILQALNSDFLNWSDLTFGIRKENLLLSKIDDFKKKYPQAEFSGKWYFDRLFSDWEKFLTYKIFKRTVHNLCVCKFVKDQWVISNIRGI